MTPLLCTVEAVVFTSNGYNVTSRSADSSPEIWGQGGSADWQCPILWAATHAWMNVASRPAHHMLPQGMTSTERNQAVSKLANKQKTFIVYYSIQYRFIQLVRATLETWNFNQFLARIRMKCHNEQLQFRCQNASSFTWPFVYLVTPSSSL